MTPKPTTGNSVSVYLHIPFCRKKCPYCHFYVIPDKEETKAALLDGLLTEIQRHSTQLANNTVVSVYFGGGTPALFGPAKIAQVLSALPLDHCQEVTLEANPEDITTEMMAAYAAAGIDRVSIGLQSLDDTLLQTLGRGHTAKQAEDAVIATAQAGITNITVDLMYDLPGQTLQQWQETLDKTCLLPITHLSLYNLTIEPHTSFYKRRDALRLALPNPNTSATMYKDAVTTLYGAGLHQYEISAFAKDDRRAIHNSGYWQGRPFLGFGPSAYSYWNGERYRNVANLNRYLRALDNNKSPVDERERLGDNARIRELLIIALRLVEGVDLQAFQRKHGSLCIDVCQGIDRLVEDRLLERKGHRLLLTQQGILFYDTVATHLVAD